MQHGPQCPSCKAFLETAREVWKCNWCASNICDRCYADHTSDKHVATLHADVVKKLAEEKKQQEQEPAPTT